MFIEDLIVLYLSQLTRFPDRTEGIQQVARISIRRTNETREASGRLVTLVYPTPQLNLILPLFYIKVGERGWIVVGYYF